MTGLYVHVPFCARACPYCDFDFEVGTAEVSTYHLALAREIEGRGLAGTRVSTVYVGGGTPSALGPDGLARLFESLARAFVIEPGAEITIEVNPEHADSALFRALVAVGANRVSIGVQSLRDHGLSLLGRVHDAGRARSALEQAVASGLRTSADLIVGWPGQHGDDLEHELEALVGAGVGHASIYALTVEPGTPWAALIRRGRRPAPEPEVQAELLRRAERGLTAAGFVHYEVSSYARAAQVARHNAAYWDRSDYVGLGPSAQSAEHGPGQVHRRGNRSGLRAWSSAPAEPASSETLSGTQAAAEALWLGLRRLDRGVEVAPLLHAEGVDRVRLERRIRRQVVRGNLCWIEDGRSLRVAAGRWLWHDEIAADLLEDEPEVRAPGPTRPGLDAAARVR